MHARIKDSRLEYTHKLTTQLIKRYQTIVVEDLAVKNMVKKRCDPATTPARLRNAHQEIAS
uniref:transposase n=1 Tax=Okeania sp. SIO2F4 TaxID=2607790 RepID=UPI00343946ED